MDNPKVKSLSDYRLKVTSQSGQPPVNVSSLRTPAKPRLLDHVRQAIRTRHYSYRTEKAYIHWIKRFIFFHNKRHPAEMGEAEIAAFLSSLASESHVSASTQNQALAALVLLYTQLALALALTLSRSALRDNAGAARCRAALGRGASAPAPRHDSGRAPFQRADKISSSRSRRAEVPTSS